MEYTKRRLNHSNAQGWRRRVHVRRVKVAGQTVHVALAARQVSGGPIRRKFARAFLWGCSCKRLKLAQLLGRHGVCLTCRTEVWNRSVASGARCGVATWPRAAAPFRRRLVYFVWIITNEN
jgi:hypothetical protein